MQCKCAAPIVSAVCLPTFETWSQLWSSHTYMRTYFTNSRLNIMQGTNHTVDHLTYDHSRSISFQTNGLIRSPGCVYNLELFRPQHTLHHIKSVPTTPSGHSQNWLSTMPLHCLQTVYTQKTKKLRILR